MISHIERVERYNKERGFIEKGFNADLENSFLLSEELETLCSSDLSRDLGLGVKHHDEFAKQLIGAYKETYDTTEDELLAYIDKVIDHWYFGVGGLLKMGLTPNQIDKLFSIVEDSNETKSKKNKDGKNIKGDSFVDPKWDSRVILRHSQDS